MKELLKTLGTMPAPFSRNASYIKAVVLLKRTTTPAPPKKGKDA